MRAIQQLIDIILRRRAVSDLVYDPSIALISVALLIVANAFMLAVTSDLSNPMIISVAQYVLNSLLIYAVLQIQRKANRAVQVLSALYGTQIILQAVGVMAVFAPILGIFALFALVWSVVLSILILKESLESSTFIAVLWTFGISGVGTALLATLFPEYAAHMMHVVQEMQSANS